MYSLIIVLGSSNKSGGAMKAASQDATLNLTYNYFVLECQSWPTCLLIERLNGSD